MAQRYGQKQHVRTSKLKLALCVAESVGPLRRFRGTEMVDMPTMNMLMVGSRVAEENELDVRCTGCTRMVYCHYQGDRKVAPATR